MDLLLPNICHKVTSAATDWAFTFNGKRTRCGGDTAVYVLPGGKKLGWQLIGTWDAESTPPG